MKKNFINLSLCAAVLCIPYQSNAAIIDVPGNMFQDQGTGFLWQDLSQYYNMSTVAVRANLTGTDFHLATLVELTTLQAGLPITDPSWLSYEAIMGANSSVREIIWGTFDDPNLGPNLVNWSWADRPFPGNPFPQSWKYGTGVGDDYSQSDLGAWVVCDNNGQICTSGGNTIPEPATLALFGLGLAGMGFARKKRRSA